ncbi:hypothetical protein PBY51_015069 [Eleginops maclovinus]|uniref:Uncharacterized protein n=1 Tax=Eleginops maclovinus TaxID=56733 RepID=A0AAN8A815_ELEMC|nr:hypothetical protein PBY51_015069 [Eleginops maclovinus]
MRVRSADLFLEVALNRSATECLYKARIHTQLQSYSTERTTHHSASLCKSTLQLKQQSMKRTWLLLSLPLLPTITETLEDLPVRPSSSQPTQSAPSLDDYMTSIQALARSEEAPSCGPVRLQRSPRLRQFSKAQMKLSVSASLPLGSPRSLRTSRLYSLGLNSTEISLSCWAEKKTAGAKIQ